ncbi:hypothetical protein V6N11_029617 [Hibiscus sabdariffa]|uniref:Uncharacterized protein n=1 Tax=Hibiscus sabdariffa TaxID=183260 RepID=A0ABR2P7R1_9ROSI
MLVLRLLSLGLSSFFASKDDRDLLSEWSHVCCVGSWARLLSNYVFDLVTSRYHIGPPSGDILASASLKKLSFETLPKGVPIPPSGPSTRTLNPPPSPFEMLSKGVPIPPLGPSRRTSDSPPSPSFL